MSESKCNDKNGCISVFLADDHAVVREGLRLLLEMQPDIKVIGEASDGYQCMRQVTALLPDIVLMDISMPGINGIEATAEIRASHPNIEVLILTMHSDGERISRALRSGARGYVLKKSAGQDVIDAIRTVHAGRRYISPSVGETLIEEYLRVLEDGPSDLPLGRLSTREREILQLTAEGKSVAIIARMLFISDKTVRTYRSRLMEKLGLYGTAALVKFAVQHGLTSLE